MPATTILPFAWSATAFAPTVRAEGGRLPAVAGEARIERAVRVVAGEREGALEAGADGVAHGDDLAVGLDRHPGRPVRQARESGPLLAVAGEALVEGAVRVVAGEGEAFVACAADHDDLAVGLNRHPRRSGAAPEAGVLLAVAGEARVERAVGLVTGEGEGASRPAAPDHDDFAVGREGHRRRIVDAAPKVGRLHAVAGEGRVEVAGGGLRSRRDDKADKQSGDESGCTSCGPQHLISSSSLASEMRLPDAPPRSHLTSAEPTNTFATEALAAGISIFELAHVMETNDDDRLQVRPPSPATPSASAFTRSRSDARLSPGSGAGCR